MDLKIRDVELKEAEAEMVEQFCERYTSSMIRKSPEEIIHMWLDYQYARFKFKEGEQYITIYDFEKHMPIASISQDFPSATRLAYEMCDCLNNMYDPDNEESLIDLLKSLSGADEEWKSYS